MNSQDVGTLILVAFGAFLIAGAAYSSHKVKMIDRAIERREAAEAAQAPPAE